ncbi:hypothetical protein D3C87_905750 [compost metagenome]
MDEALEDRKVDVYVVNRQKNHSVGERFTLQIGVNHRSDWDRGNMEIRRRLNEIASVNDDGDPPDNYWGYDYKDFPTLCSVVKMICDICGKNLEDPWFGATLTYGEVVTLLKADLEKENG